MDMVDFVVESDGDKNAIESQQEVPEERNKRLFRYWMSCQVKPEGDSDAGNPYSEASIDQYVSNVANTPLSSMPDRSVFYTTNVGEVQITIEALDNSDRKNNTQRSAVKKYMEYLHKTYLSIQLVLNCVSFGEDNESSNELLKFQPFLEEKSIHKIEVIAENGDSIIYSTKYDSLESVSLNADDGEESTTNGVKIYLNLIKSFE